jgi:predicted ATPase
MRPDLPSGTVTFLFTDVEGSTRLLHELGAEGYADALAHHRRLVRSASAANGGVEVDTQGDAFFIAFPTAPGALAAAEAMTDALAPGPIRVRIGLHTGTTLVTDEGYVGNDVHVAARVAATGHGGQVVVSAATAALAGRTLVDLGEHRLKDVEGPMRLFQLGTGTFAPLRTIGNTNLPRPASSFLGRERELGDVEARIRDGARLLTLTGPGGTGKTRLALEAATSLVGEFPGGTFWVGLAALRDPALVTEAIAQAIGAKDGLAEHIGARATLLLLDNLEQVIGAAPELANLVAACPNLVVMTTSRELLRVAGEVEYAVPPLAQAEAIDLFCARAQLEPTPEIAELCARLDALPLAVELAAARTRALTPAAIIERLGQRLDLLRGGRDADPRQQTLRATIEWSTDLLEPGDRALFGRLAVFAGGCTLDAAEAIADADIDALQSLIEKSLLRRTGERYWMLATIQEFAAEGPASSDPALRRRHAEFYRDLAVRTDARLRGHDEAEQLKVLDAEQDNIRAALSWAVEHDPEVGADLAVATQRYWWIRGQEPEQERWLDALLGQRDRLARHPLGRVLAESASVATMLDDWGRAVAHGEQALAIARELGDDDIAYRALMALSEGYDMVGRDADAEAAYSGARRAAQATGDRLREAATIYNLGVSVGERDRPRALTLMSEAMAIAEDVGSVEAVASSLIGIGSLLREDGRVEEALPMLLDGIARVAPLGFPVRTALGLVEVAAVLVDRGDPERAVRLLGTAEATLDAAGMASDRTGDEVRRLATETLGTDGVAALLADGRAMTLDDAVALAVGDRERSDGP